MTYLFQQLLSPHQFAGCGDAHKKSAELDPTEQLKIDKMQSRINAVAREIFDGKRDLAESTAGKRLSIDELRALFLFTPVSWVAKKGASWSFFKVLSVKIFCLYAYCFAKRSVRTRSIKMLNLWSSPASSQQLQGWEGTPEKGVPLTVVEAVSDKDKGTQTAKERAKRVPLRYTALLLPDQA